MYTKQDLKDLSDFLFEDGNRTFSDHIRRCGYDDEGLKVFLSTWQGPSVGAWVSEIFFCPFNQIPQLISDDHLLSQAVFKWRLERGV